MIRKKISIVGTVGIPANYGGFETLVENLVRYHSCTSLSCLVVVYCSSKNFPSKDKSYLSSKLNYVPLNANGAQSIFYDIWSLLAAVIDRSSVILLLGISGAIALPLVRLISPVRIITNIDGIEWRREKWKGFSKYFLRLSEIFAVRFSHELIADNAAIAEYIKVSYGESAHVIAYGGDHAVKVDVASIDEYGIPKNYSFSVCRIEPENNIHLILEAFSSLKFHNLVVVGNWNSNEYGRALRNRYCLSPNLFLLDPVYSLGQLKALRENATFYIHGHSAGGTNPSLVEAMHFGRPVIAFDCEFNRYTTENSAYFFSNSDELVQLINSIDTIAARKVGFYMIEIAQRRYTWHIVAKQYFDLF